MKTFILFLIGISFFGSIAGQTAGQLTVTFTTSKTSTPTYNPKNIVAVWIIDSNGKFVKTLLALASERKADLVGWKTVTTIAASSYNTVDAITGATQSSHGTRNCTWNGKDKLSVLVPDGNYTLKMEVTDNDLKAQNIASFVFVKGTSAQTLTSAATSGFSNISITWTPVNTAVETTKTESEYKLYPNPAETSFFVTGFDIKAVDIYTLNGTRVLSSATPFVNISTLPGGVYLANIVTRNENVVLKFTKK